MLDLKENPVPRADFIELLTLHLREKNYSQTAIKVLDILVHIMVKTPKIYRKPKLLNMSEHDLAQACRCNITQVRFALDELENAGLIKRVRILESKNAVGQSIYISCLDLSPSFLVFENSLHVK